jgi:hypothetical protein
MSVTELRLWEDILGEHFGPIVSVSCVLKRNVEYISTVDTDINVAGRVLFCMNRKWAFN